jgi:hypothetical protein
MMLFAAASLAAALHAFGCSEPDTSSLAERAERDDVYVAVEQRHVACRCPGIQLLCSSSCATDIEVYALVLAREGAADGDPCEPRIDANARASGGQVGEVEVTSKCHETRYEWDGHSPPTQIVLEDATTTWTLVDPFARPSATLVAPAAEDLGRGATARIVVPGVRLREATARLTSSRASSEDIVLDVAVEDDRAELTLPDDLLGSARYDLSFSSATALLASACEGPPACRGFSVHEQWSFSVPADPIPDDGCSLMADSVCADDLACYSAGPSGETLCLPPGAIAIGEFCEASSDCVRGASCHPSRREAQRKQCYELCEVQPTDDRSTCPSGHSCDWLNATGHQSLGACVEDP